MKITFTSHILARGSQFREPALNLKVTGTKEVQVSKLIRAGTSKVFDRGNFLTHISFTATRYHATQEEAFAYLLSHADEISEIKGPLSLEFHNTAFLLKTASLKTIQSSIDGLTTSHHYTFIGSNINPQQPKES